MNGNELKALRLRKGMTQEDVARTIGVSRITIRNWELGINTPNAAYIPKLARLFGRPVDEVIRLFGGPYGAGRAIRTRNGRPEAQAAPHGDAGDTDLPTAHA